MLWQIDILSLEKAGNRPDDYEDAATYTLLPNETGVCIAVADGAAGGFESRKWATALSDAFVHFQTIPDEQMFAEWLSVPAQGWHDSIHWEELKWYHRAKARDGAFATLLGVFLEVSPSTKNTLQGQWHALAVGDACLFQIRQDNFRLSFPLENAEEFDSSPPLLSTKASYNEKSLKFLTMRSGDYASGDSFFLMTDALSHWFLKEIEDRQMPWREIDALDETNFPAWIEGKRRHGGLHNDDVTLVRCRLADSENPETR